MDLIDEPLFTPLLPRDTSRESRVLLEQVKRELGFVPNLLACLAHSPTALNAYVAADAAFQRGTLTAAEQQIVLLAASSENDCPYCTSAHSALAKFFLNVPGDVIVAVQANRPLPDPKLDALVNLTRQVVSRRGHVRSQTIATFLNAGYSKGQLLEVLVGVGLKTISNYFDHISAIEIDAEFSDDDSGKAASGL